MNFAHLRYSIDTVSILKVQKTLSILKNESIKLKETHRDEKNFNFKIKMQSNTNVTIPVKVELKTSHLFLFTAYKL